MKLRLTKIKGCVTSTVATSGTWTYPGFFGGKFVFSTVVIRITFVGVIKHPFMKMVGNVKCTVIITAEFVIYHHQFGIHVVIFVAQVMSEQNVTSLQVIVTKYHWGIDMFHPLFDPINFLHEVDI